MAKKTVAKKASKPTDKPAAAPAPFDPDAPVTTVYGNAVRDLSLAVYTERLGADAVSRMLRKYAQDGVDGQARLRTYAGAYDSLSRAYLKASAQYKVALKVMDDLKKSCDEA